MPALCMPSCGSRHSLDAELVNSADPYDSDPYDPRKPEYISSASTEEVENTNRQLLGQQIHKLETIITKSKERLDLSAKNGKLQVVQHYEHILNEMRWSAGLVNSNFRAKLALELDVTDVDEWYTNQCEELGMIDECEVEHEAPQLPPSIKTGPGELLRQCSAMGAERMMTRRGVPQSAQKQQWPSTESDDPRHQSSSFVYML